MVKYGLFAAQRAQELSSHIPSCISSPLLKPCAVPWCGDTLALPVLALLGNSITQGKRERSFCTSPSLPGRLSTFPVCLWGRKSGGSSRAGRFQPGTPGSPREQEHVLVHSWLMIFGVRIQSGFSCLQLFHTRSFHRPVACLQSSN